MRFLLFCAVLCMPLTTFAATFEARINSMQSIPCPDGGDGCFHVQLESENGVMKTDVAPQDYLAQDEPGYGQGNRVVVQAEDIDGETQVFISDIVRRPALAWLLLLFVVATAILGRMAGLRSLLSLALSFGLIFGVLIPAILAGYHPLPVTITVGTCVMAVTLLISYGWNPKILSALAGIGGSLLVTGFLAVAFSQWAAMTGMNEDMLFLLSTYPDLDTRGILLAGIIIGTLGVLDDVTVSQASAVFELRGANPLLTAKDLTVRALRIGKDHISAAVNTLVLAYAGSSLPLLLLLSGGTSDESWFIIINREMIAMEILRTLVGSIGLLAAVPLTTWIAAKWAVRLPPVCGEHGQHHHAH